MNVTLVLDCKAPLKVKLAEEKTIRQLLEEHKVNLETGIIKLNGKIAHPDKELTDKDKVEFIGVIYGG